MIKFILWTIFVVFLASLIAAIISLFYKKYRKLGICYLWWVLFPFIFPWYAKKNVVITHQWKSWLLVLISPCALSIYLFTLLAIGLCISMDSVVNEVPGSTDYHNASDLTRATGVEFPEVLPVDSLWHYDWCNHYTRVKFVPIKPLTKSFFKRLDRACVEDSCCWLRNEKDSCYYYHIFPERPLDRTKGTHDRKVEWENQDGTITIMDEWNGDYVEVVVPFKGDTITIEDGWIR